MAFGSGALNRVLQKDSAASSYTTLCDFRHEMDLSDEGHEITSSCHDGIQAFVSSILRGQATASFHIKNDQYPWNLNIKAQAKGLIQIEFCDRQPFVFPYYISRVNYMNETAGGTDYTVTFKLNAEAGTLSYPS